MILVPATVLEPHGPSMYTLSMVLTFRELTKIFFSKKKDLQNHWT